MEAVFLDSENRLQISKKQKHLSEKELTEEQQKLQEFINIFDNPKEYFPDYAPEYFKGRSREKYTRNKASMIEQKLTRIIQMETMEMDIMIGIFLWRLTQMSLLNKGREFEEYDLTTDMVTEEFEVAEIELLDIFKKRFHYITKNESIRKVLIENIKKNEF